jgi:hypothetical protein
LRVRTQGDFMRTTVTSRPGSGKSRFARDGVLRMA